MSDMLLMISRFLPSFGFFPEMVLHERHLMNLAKPLLYAFCTTLRSQQDLVQITFKLVSRLLVLALWGDMGLSP